MVLFVLFADMDYTVHLLIQFCLIWKYVALLVKMYTTAVLECSQMKLICLMFYQVCMFSLAVIDCGKISKSLL